MRVILVIILVTALFVLYLFKHRYSVAITQDIAKLEKDTRLLKDEIIMLEAKKNELFLFSNLEIAAKNLNLTFSKETKALVKASATDSQPLLVMRHE